MPRICDWPGDCNSLRYCCEQDGFRFCRDHKIEFMMGCAVCQADLTVEHLRKAKDPKVLCETCQAKNPFLHTAQ